MPADLRVSADAAFNTAHSVQNDAEELREELSGLAREWDNVSRGWSGAAATVYTALWDKWHDGATKLVDSLADSSECLARAATLYEDQDRISAEVLHSQTTIDLGL